MGGGGTRVFRREGKSEGLAGSEYAPLQEEQQARRCSLVVGRTAVLHEIKQKEEAGPDGGSPHMVSLQDGGTPQASGNQRDLPLVPSSDPGAQDVLF